jgi:hypothetical protein
MHAFVVKQILTRKISPCAHTRLQIWTQYIRLLDTQRKTREVHNACEPSSWADLRIALAVGDSLPRMRGQDAKMDVGDSLAGLLPGRTHELSSREIRTISSVWTSGVSPLGNSMVRICWCLWRHRNDVVFEGVTASPHTVIRNIRREAELWKATGLFKAELALVDR